MNIEIAKNKDYPVPTREMLNSFQITVNLRAYWFLGIVNRIIIILRRASKILFTERFAG